MILALATGLALTPIWSLASVYLRPGPLRVWAALRAALSVLVLVLLAVDPLTSLVPFFALVVVGPLLFGGASLGLRRGVSSRAATLSALFGGLACFLAGLGILAFFLEFLNTNPLSTTARPWSPTSLTFAIAFPASLAFDAAAGWAWALENEAPARLAGWGGALRLLLTSLPALLVFPLAGELIEGASGPVCVALLLSLPVSVLAIWALPLRFGVLAGLAALLPIVLFVAP